LPRVTDALERFRREPGCSLEVADVPRGDGDPDQEGDPLLVVSECAKSSIARLVVRLGQRDSPVMS
jgi:hypothetical protein